MHEYTSSEREYVSNRISATIESYICDIIDKHMRE